MFRGMSLRCLLGFHRVSLATILPKARGYTGLCESCGRPLERGHASAWAASEPLDQPRRRAA